MSRIEKPVKHLQAMRVPVSSGGAVEVHFGSPERVDTQDGSHRKRNELSEAARCDLRILLRHLSAAQGRERALFRELVRYKITWVRYFES
jgi:hypothetical protein